MRVGIDFGTTRIVVAAADRGNYPLVNFLKRQTAARTTWFPSVAAITSKQQRVYGWDALDLHGKPGWTLVRSLKRGLKTAGPYSEIEIDGQRLNLAPCWCRR